MGCNQIMNFSMVSYHSYRKRYTLHINVKSARYQCRHSSGWNIEFTIFYLWGFLSSLPLTTASTKDRKPKADIPPPSSEHSSAPGFAMNITGAGFFFLITKTMTKYNGYLWAIIIVSNQSVFNCLVLLLYLHSGWQGGHCLQNNEIKSNNNASPSL